MKKIEHARKTKPASEVPLGGVGEAGNTTATDGSKSWSYSIRLTEPERKLIFQAAELKGWTPTSLIKLAVIERAAHIINTSRLTKFDFGALTRQIAKQLCEPDIKGLDTQQPDVEFDANSYLNNHADQYEYFTGQALKDHSLEQLREAARLGGVEFLDQVLNECDRLLPRNRSQFPDTIDPAKLA